VDACLAGLLDGAIDCIVTDHAPHAAGEKAAGFLKAPAGIIGLETAVGLAARALIETGRADWPRLIQWFTSAPARIVRRPPRPIHPGRRADLTIIHPTRAWTVRAQNLLSRSKNTPFDGWTLPCSIQGTLQGDRHIRPNTPSSR
jgi:dihydroorotase